MIPDFAVDYTVRMREILNFNLYLGLLCLSGTRCNYFILRLFFLSRFVGFFLGLSFVLFFPLSHIAFFFPVDLAYINCPDYVNYLAGYFFQFMVITK